jgi:hypothetical protein
MGIIFTVMTAKSIAAIIWALGIVGLGLAQRRSRRRMLRLVLTFLLLVIIGLPYGIWVLVLSKTSEALGLLAGILGGVAALFILRDGAGKENVAHWQQQEYSNGGVGSQKIGLALLPVSLIVIYLIFKATP